MKKHFFKIGSLLLSVALIKDVLPYNAISNAADTKYSNNGSLICSTYDIMEIKSANETRLSFADVINGSIVEVDSEPNDFDEAISMVKELYPDINYSVRGFLVKGDNPYIIRFDRTENGTIEKIKCDYDISYIADIDNGEILDYKTNDVIQSLKTNNKFYYGTADKGYVFVYYMSEDKDFIASVDNSTYTYEQLTGEKISSIIELGDINADGEISLTDLTELSLAIIGDKTFTEDQLKAADINKNGKADLPDLARLQQYLSKKIPSLG